MNSQRVTCLQNSGTSQHAPTDRIYSPPSIQVHTLQSAEPVGNLFTLASAYLFVCLPSGRVILHDPQTCFNILLLQLHEDGTLRRRACRDMTCFTTMVLSRSSSGQTKATLANLVRIRVKVKTYHFKIKHNTMKAYGGVEV